MVKSALPPKADMCGALAYVCFGPIADICLGTPVSKMGPLSAAAPRSDNQRVCLAHLDHRWNFPATV
jgi:hypothetical protein